MLIIIVISNLSLKAITLYRRPSRCIFAHWSASIKILRSRMKHMDNFKLKILYFCFTIKYFYISWEEQMLCHPVMFDRFFCWKEINSLNINFRIRPKPSKYSASSVDLLVTHLPRVKRWEASGNCIFSHLRMSDGPTEMNKFVHWFASIQPWRK